MWGRESVSTNTQLFYTISIDPRLTLFEYEGAIIRGQAHVYRNTKGNASIPFLLYNFTLSEKE